MTNTTTIIGEGTTIIGDGATITEEGTNITEEGITITGKDTIIVVVKVFTPTQTDTSFCTSDFTTTMTITGGPRENNTVIVEIPKSTNVIATTYGGSMISNPFITEEGTNIGDGSKIVVVEFSYAH